MRQPNRWSCLPTAFAIVLKVELKLVIEKVGHDGSKIMWPNLPEPMCRRSFHIREMIDACYCFGYAVIQIDKHPISVVDYDKTWDNIGVMLESAIGFGSAKVEQLQAMLKAYNVCNESARLLKDKKFNVDFEKYMMHNDGVLIGQAENNLHAVAWVGNKIIDPSRPWTEAASKFEIQQFFMVRKMQ